MLSAAPPYHLKVLDHFKQQRSTWDFFAAAGTREEQLVSFKTDLLKNTYKFQPGTDPQIYEKITLVKERLGLGELPVTAYQAQYTDEGNASILYFHGEAHLVFSGDLTQRLNGEELLAVIAHELTHIKLYTLADGELEVADRIITAIANNNNSSAPYYETARLFRLYTEIYCDRGALAVLGDTTPVINMLLKIATGLPVVHAESYRQQAEEIFSASPATRSVTGTHPENFIRTHALRLWFEKKEAAEPEITRMIEGLPELDRLDIFSQKELAGLTRDFLLYYLRPKWFQSTLVTSLARQYFQDLYEERPAALVSGQSQIIFPQGAGTGNVGDDENAEHAGSVGSIRSAGKVGKVESAGNAGDSSALNPEQMAVKLAGAHSSVREYFAYLLLDFVLVDPSLEEIPSGRAFQLAEEMQLSSVYDPIAKKELQFSDKKWDGYKQQTRAAYAAIKED